MKKYKFTVQFRLEKRKDTPKDKDGKMLNPQILADITFDSKRIFYYVGYRIDESKWINDKAADGTRIQQAKKNTFNKRGESATEINMQRQISAATEMLKGEAERLITNEILSEEKQIELLQAIDRHCFRQAQTIVEEAARHAAAQNFDHLISDLDTLSRGLYQMSRMTGEMQPKN